MDSSYIKEYSVGNLGRSSCNVAVGDIKVGVGRRTTHLTSQKVDCWTDGGKFV